MGRRCKVFQHGQQLKLETTIIFISPVEAGIPLEEGDKTAAGDTAAVGDTGAVAVVADTAAVAGWAGRVGCWAERGRPRMGCIHL